VRTITTTSVASPGPIDSMAARRAIEALRAGVPSTVAIASRDSLQPDVDSRFSELCSELRDLPSSGRPARGLVVGGGFGTGKTHLLAQLRAQASREGFVTSAVTISKEVPLHDIVRVGKAMLASATADGAQRDVIERLADQVNVNDVGWVDLKSQVRRLDPRFGASVALYGQPGTSDEVNEHLIRFWAGEPLHLPTVRRALTSATQAGGYSFERISERDLWAQRVGFAARLARTTGHAGWVVTFDEAELVGRYPSRQRLRSYAELGRWLRRRPADPTAPLGAVVAITDDYQAAILDHKGDRKLPSKLPYRLDEPQTASAAELGIKIIQRDLIPLQPATPRNLQAIQTRLQNLHATAYNWTPPPAPGLPPRSTNQLRHHIRAWISQWDIYRHYPTLQPETELHQIPTTWEDRSA
jgi:BREX system ATP-binding protein BrxC/D